MRLGSKVGCMILLELINTIDYSMLIRQRRRTASGMTKCDNGLS